MKPLCFSCPSIRDIRTHIHQACSVCKNNLIRVVTLWHRRTDALMNITKSYLFEYNIETTEVDNCEDGAHLLTSGLADTLLLPPHMRRTMPNHNIHPIRDAQSGIFSFHTPEPQRRCSHLFLWQLEWIEKLPSSFG